MHRRDLGITGQCVHCQAPLTALEQHGSIQVISGLAPQCAATLSAPQEANFLTDRNKLPDVNQASAPVFQQSALFCDFSGEPDESISSLFKNEDNSSQIISAWGTKIPRENHAPISPFATGSAGGGFAESLFREKVTKESSKIESALLAVPVAKKEESTTIAPAREEGGKKVTVDNDGPPMKTMTNAEAGNLDKHLFAIEKTYKKPHWVKHFMQPLLALTVLATMGVSVYFATPEERLATWKEKAYAWFEPGLAALDYVPEGLRPGSLPQKNLGRAGGADNKNEPKRKQNLFESLNKLDGDIGNMRRAAEGELKNINQL